MGKVDGEDVSRAKSLVVNMKTWVDRIYNEITSTLPSTGFYSASTVV